MNRIDEIQVLLHQDEMNQLRPHFTKADAINIVKELISNIAALKANEKALSEVAESRRQEILKQDEQIAALTAENERLRSALPQFPSRLLFILTSIMFHV
jgi:hypothetical protein